jgi:hypothetical protein
MKKVLSVFALLGAVTLGYSQGTVNTSTTVSSFAVSTNNTLAGLAGRTYGTVVDTGGQSYDYILLYSATAVAPVTLNSTPSTIAAWSLGPTEANGIGPGYILGSSSAALGNAATAYYIELVGWSTGLGTSFSSIESTIESGSTSIANQYLGFGYQSAAGLVSSQVTTATSPAPGTTIFSAGAINSGFDLNLVVATPEPSTIALGVMGAASLLALRRKKA